jgi:uncharacterized membrane protein (UPF0127 family)
MIPTTLARRDKLALMAVMLIAAVGCEATTSPSALPTVPMQLGDKKVTLEIARDTAVQEHGLMERDSMDHDHGMIFPLPEYKVWYFWNHHVRFPLDIIFCDRGGKVVSIVQLKAYDETNVGSEHEAQYAIELNKGCAAEFGVKVGDHLSIPNDALIQPTTTQAAK